MVAGSDTHTAPGTAQTRVLPAEIDRGISYHPSPPDKHPVAIALVHLRCLGYGGSVYGLSGGKPHSAVQSVHRPTEEKSRLRFRIRVLCDSGPIDTLTELSGDPCVCHRRSSGLESDERGNLIQVTTCSNFSSLPWETGYRVAAATPPLSRGSLLADSVFLRCLLFPTRSLLANRLVAFPMTGSGFTPGTES